MRYVVTGAGMVGRAVGERLASEGHQVLTVDRRSEGADVVDDLTDADRLAVVLAGVDGVFHTAALHGMTGARPDQFLASNVIATWNVCEAIRLSGVPRLVHSSTVGVYGEARPLAIDADTTPAGVSDVYGLTKRMAEMVVDHFRTRPDGFDAVALRYGGIVQTVRSRFGEVPTEWAASGALVDLDDVVSANLMAMHRLPLPRHAYVVAPTGGSPTSDYRVDASVTERDLGLHFVVGFADIVAGIPDGR